MSFLASRKTSCVFKEKKNAVELQQLVQELISHHVIWDPKVIIFIECVGQVHSNNLQAESVAETIRDIASVAIGFFLFYLFACGSTF